MSGMQPALARWWQGDRKILLIFSLYGLATGTLSYIASLSYDDQFTEWVATVANFPTLLTMLFVEWNIANPNGFFILNQYTMIIGSILVRTFIGLIVYYLIKMFKMGP